MSVKEQGQFRSGLRQQSNDVILQNFSSCTAPWAARVAETSQVYKEHFEFMDGKEMGDLTEPTRMLTEAMDDGNGTLGFFWSKLSVVESDIGQF